MRSTVVLAALVFAVAFLGCGQPDNRIQLPVEEKGTQPSAPGIEQPTTTQHATLHDAVKAGDVEDVRKHLANGADVNELGGEDSVTPLILASSRDNLEVVRVLLENGADVNCKDSDGLTPLHFAARFCSLEFVRLLVDSGAEIDAFSNMGGLVGSTPLMVAVGSDRPNIVRYLAENGAGIDLSTKGSTKCTPLYAACEFRHFKVAKVLIELGADVNQRCPIVAETGLGIEQGPLHAAAYKGHRDIVQLLLEGGADLNGVSGVIEGTALDFAELGGHVELADFLRSRGATANPNIKLVEWVASAEEHSTDLPAEKEPSSTFLGKCVAVTDGDTIEVMHDGKAEKIRLHGIDCPESHQDFGSKAKQFTSGLVFGKEVIVDVRDVGKYGRTIGVVTADGENLNQALVAAGLAWWYREYAPDDETLQGLEAQAKAQGVGLWSMPDPVAPWDFRHGGGETVATAAATDGESSEVYLTPTGEKYHKRFCSTIKKSKQLISCSVADALAGGYEPCKVCKPPMEAAGPSKLTSYTSPDTELPVTESAPPVRSYAIRFEGTPVAPNPETQELIRQNQAAARERGAERNAAQQAQSDAWAQENRAKYERFQNLSQYPNVQEGWEAQQMSGYQRPATQGYQRRSSTQRQSQGYGQSAAPQTTTQPETSGTTVYVTRTGEKYHRGSCRYLRQSKIPISLSEAKAQGYGPCSVCKPPR